MTSATPRYCAGAALAARWISCGGMLDIDAPDGVDDVIAAGFEDVLKAELGLRLSHAPLTCVPGDPVRLRHDIQHLGLRAGERGTVRAICGLEVTVDLIRGRSVEVDARELEPAEA